MKNERKLCLRFWLALIGKEKYEILLLLAGTLLFPRNVSMGLVTLTLFAYMSLTFFPGQAYQLLVLTVPFDRQTIWRTHLAAETILYFVLLLGFLLRNRWSLPETLAILLSVVFAHLTCAIIPRRPLLWLVSALPGFAILMLVFTASHNHRIGPMMSALCRTTAFRLFLVLLNVLLVLLDIIVWRKEEQRFLKGASHA
ncbi:MAG: hypothetical protein KBS74_04535 [Clostridiales bacterium]|nr:hypothetical protein [Candidatus Cacconaster stercorequi]